MLRYGFDATAAGLANQWLSKLDDISMVVDLVDQAADDDQGKVRFRKGI